MKRLMVIFTTVLVGMLIMTACQSQKKGEGQEAENQPTEEVLQSDNDIDAEGGQNAANEGQDESKVQKETHYAEFELIVDEDFESGDDYNYLSDSDKLKVRSIEEDHFMYPAPYGSRVLAVEDGSALIKGSLGKVIPDSVYTVTMYAALNTQDGIGNINIYLKNGRSDKIVRGAMSAQGASFKLNGILWNRVMLTVDASELSGFEASDELVYEIKASNVMLDDLMVTRRTSAPRDFHVSNTDGTDDGIGTLEAPLKDLRTASSFNLVPGDRLLLKRGNMFHERFYLFGKGTEDALIEVGAYGEGAMPVIELGENKLTDVLFTYENASHVRISDLHLREGKIGLYLRYYQDYGNRNVTVDNCLFENFDDEYCAPHEYQYELGFSSGIWLSGLNPGGQSDVLDGLTLTDNRFEYCISGFNTNWFYFDHKGHPKDILRNLTVAGGHAKASSVAGSLLVQWTDGVTVTDFRQFGRNPIAKERWFMWGTTGMMFGSSKNILVERCELSDVDRWADNHELLKAYVEDPALIRENAGGFDDYFGLHYAFSGDACGIDIDGNNENVTFRNNVVHNNDGMGLELLTTMTANKNVVIEDCTFYNNGTNVKNKYEVNDFYHENGEWVIEYNYDRYLFHGDAWEVKLDNMATGSLDNVNMYRAETSFGWISHNNNRIEEGEYGEYWYRDIQDLPTAKTFDQTGTLSSDSQFIMEGIFINPFRMPTLDIDFKADSQGSLKVYYITDVDRTYSEDKVFEAKGSGDEGYTVDLMADGYMGVIIGIKIAPEGMEGKAFSLDTVAFKGESIK